MGTYKQIDHTADVAVRLEGDNYEDLIRTAAAAWREVVLENSQGAPVEKKQLTFETSSLEELLVNCIDELNYLLTVKRWVFYTFEYLKVEKSEEIWKLNAEIAGELLDPQRHSIEIEIKAVTFHQLNIEKENGVYRTLLVFDI